MSKRQKSAYNVNNVMRGTASLWQYRATRGEAKVRTGRDDRTHRKKEKKKS